MKTIRNLFLIALVAGFAACTNETFVEEPLAEVDGSATIKEITVNLPEILNDVDTRTTFTMSESGVTAAWAENDTIGIFPNQGGQVEFPTVSGAGSNTAKFNGGGWGLKNANTYSAYYPYNKANIYRDNKHILLDYTGQTQVGNNNADHLGAYDYLASGAVSPHNGYLTLDMQRLGSIVKFELNVAGLSVGISNAYFSGMLTLSSDALLVKKAELDISGSSPVVTPIETSHELTIYLKDAYVSDDKLITVYAMLSPVNLTEGNVGISLQGGLHSIDTKPPYLEWAGYPSSAFLGGRNLLSGKPYAFSADLEKKDNLVSINDNALVRELIIDHWDTNRDGLFSTEEAASVTSIGTLFAGKDIKYVPLNYFTGITAIEDGAFKDCTKLGSITIPENVSSIGKSAFEGCSLLRNAYLPDNLQSVGESAFKDCTNLRSIDIPDNVTIIGDSAFYKCYDLSNVTLSNKLQYLGNYTFYMCERMEGEIELSDNLTFLGESAFNNCNVLYKIVISGEIEEIKNDTFLGCFKLVDVKLPNSINTIGDYAFANCSLLQNINIPESLMSIGKGAFINCHKLPNLNLHDEISYIGASAFYNCRSISILSFPRGVSSIAGYTYAGCYGLTDVVIPSWITTIEEGAFCFDEPREEYNYTGNIKFISLGTSVSLIDRWAFSYNKTIERLVSFATTPPVFFNGRKIDNTIYPCSGDFDPFPQTNVKDCPIYVPAESVEAYKVADGWRYYADNIQAIDPNDGSATNPDPGSWNPGGGGNNPGGGVGGAE